MQFKINNVIVNFCGIDAATEQEVQDYIEYVKENFCLLVQDNITSITVSSCHDGIVDVIHVKYANKKASRHY